MENIQNNTALAKIWVNVLRLVGLAFIVSLFWNLNWSISSLNHATNATTIFSYIFFAAVILITIGGITMVINNWSFVFKKPLKFLENKEKPLVGIIIPTYEEPIDIVINTVESVITQDWPKDKMVIVVSDDALNTDLKKEVERIARQSGVKIIYNIPAAKNHPHRKGEGKAGNLNSALDLLNREYPEIEYIETRDSDDLVGTKNFLSYCMRSLTDDPKLSFVQTIKEARASAGDPFYTQDAIFYRRVMPARLSANAAFPCGSGLVWRKSELEKIDGFPAWNLVEDLQSGFEILRKGGKGEYLYTVGAMAQIAPEDTLNFYKQRGTWAIDTLRLFLYKNPFFVKGLTLRQRLYFFEMQFAYIQNIAYLIFAISLATTLGLGFSPVDSAVRPFIVNFAFLTIALELYFYVQSKGIGYRNQWLFRQTWLGLTHVYIVSFIKAILYGPRKKPSYKVTRKYHKHAWYWKETLPQKLIILLLSAGIISSIFRLNPENILMYLLLWFWSMTFIFAFSQSVINSWHGLNVTEKLTAKYRPIKKIHEKKHYALPAIVVIALVAILGGIYNIYNENSIKVSFPSDMVVTNDLPENTKEEGRASSQTASTTLINHIVKHGETLWGISENYYNDGFKWVFILDANKENIGFLPNGEQSLIEVGQELAIPEADLPLADR